MYGTPDPRAVVTTMSEACAAGDVPLMMALWGEASELRIAGGLPDLGYSGTLKGRDAIQSALLQVRAAIFCNVYRPTILGIEGQIVRVNVQFVGTHIRTRQRFETSFRQVFTVEGGLIARCDEFHDATRLAALMRFVNEGLPPVS